MKIFVASWFFPPSTSSEGIVTYKLLRNSAHSYDVCSAESDLWGYKHSMSADAENISVYPVATDSFDIWVDEALRIFEENNAAKSYDAFMTRTMPPESIEFARRLKERHPDLPWIASLSDPLARSPYSILWLVTQNEELREQEKVDFQMALKYGCTGWENHKSDGIRELCRLKKIEDYAINNATALIFPCAETKTYILGSRKRKNALVVPHSFDPSLFPKTERSMRRDEISFAFLGHTDKIRSLRPLVEAIKHLKRRNPNALESMKFRFIGNVPAEIQALVYNYYLYDYISIEPSVSYLDSLKIMQEVDWLVHLDAKFDTLPETGGSVFLAGKLADYMGTNAPILALTGKYSPAYEVVKRAGGAFADPDDVGAISDLLETIGERRLHTEINRDYRDTYLASNIAQDYDSELERILKGERSFSRKSWPPAPRSSEQNSKFISICVPAYKVECYLDRCLYSLISSRVADQFEILVINDGSPDSSREIALAYQEHYPSIVKLIDKENGGHGSTINTALSLATGTYFRVIDGDDWVESESFARLVEALEQTGADADIVSSNYYQVYAEDNHLVPWTKLGDEQDYILYNFASEDFSMEYFTMASTMFKTSLLKQADFKLQEKTYYVDVEYLLYPIPYAKTVLFSPEYVYRYAVGDADQSVNPEVFVSRFDHHDRVIKRMLEYYEQKRPSMGAGQTEYMKSLFKRHFLQSHYTLCLIWDTDKERGCARAREFDSYLKITDPELYAFSAKEYTAVRQARRSNYNPKKAKKFRSLHDGTKRRLIKRGVRYTADRVAATSTGYRLVHNRHTEKIARRFGL